MQQRSVETKQKILRAAMDQLLKEDDTEFRISDIVKLTGLTATSIYAYFGSRQGLIDEAYLQVYREISDIMQLILEERLRSSKTGMDFVNQMKIRQNGESEAATKYRKILMRVNGLAMLRDDFAEKLRLVKLEFNSRAAAEFLKYQKLGVIGKRFRPTELPQMLAGGLLIIGISEQTRMDLIDQDYLIMTYIFCDD
jgi:AcrR family transcriptional regulator